MSTEEGDTKDNLPVRRADYAQGAWPLYFSLRVILRLCWRILYSWQILGKEKMPATGPVILASNHASFLDPPILGCVFDRPVGYMARKSLFDNPLFGFIISKLYAFPINRDGDPRSALRTMGERLDNGEVVTLFPEGTRTRTGRLGKIKRGVGMLASRHQAAVLPVYIGGSFASWPRQRKVPGIHPLRIEVGDPIVSRDCTGDRAAAKAEERRIHDEVERVLHEMEKNYFAAVSKDLSQGAPGYSQAGEE